MAYFTSLWKSRIIEQCRQEYENEKINSLLTSKTEIPRKTIMQKWRFYGHDTKRRVKGRLRKWFPDGSSVSNVYFYLKSEHAFPNLFIKSVIGFVGGIALTYLCFVFFVYQLSISFIHATIMSSIIGVLLTLGLAFSWRMRCLVYLLIPQMFSRVGRYTLTCYALVLILTGPATNTLRNSEVLTESMACSQEQIKTSVRQIKEIVKKPFNTMKHPIKLIVERMRRAADTMKTIASDISVLVISIGDFIQSAFTWLILVADDCNKKFDTPHNHCIKAALRGVSNYRRHLGNISWLSNPSSIAKTICRTVSSDPVCVVADYATASFSATLKRKLENFITRLNTMLFVNIEFHHSHTFSNHDSSSVNEIAGGIVTEIRRRADPLLTWLSWSSCVTSLFLLLIIFRAKYYQHMFETRSRFDNRYVTKELRELDLKRYQEGRETVLPLNKRERAKYICITSFNLVTTEKVYLTRSMIFMTITTFKLLIHMVADYSLYWVLMTIRYHGNMQTPLQPGLSDFGIEISGSGIVADFIRSVIDSIVSPLLPNVSSPQTCLPKPHAPDLQRYMQIGILIILLWFFALFEPYGLRFRHVIMGHYQPERAKTRALWVFNHILRTRGSFMKLARRKLHREYKYSDQEHQTFRYWIHSVMPCRCFYNIFRRLPKALRCLLCNTLEESNDSDTKLTSCETKKCPGVYCMRCFSDIGRLCTICLSPADYGDMSDVSLEKGSSDDSDYEDPNCNNKALKLNEHTDNERESLIKKSRTKPTNRCQKFSNQSDEVQEEELSLLTDDSSNGQSIKQYKKSASYDSLKNTYIQRNKSEIIDKGNVNDESGSILEPKLPNLQNETVIESRNIKNETKINTHKNKRHNRKKKYGKKRINIGKTHFNFDNTKFNKYLKELCHCLPRTKHNRSERTKYLQIFITTNKKVPKNYTHIKKRRKVKLIFQKRKCKSHKNKKKQNIEPNTCGNKEENCLKDAHFKYFTSNDDTEGNHNRTEKSPINQRKHRHAIEHKNSNIVKRYYRLFTGLSNHRLFTSNDNKLNNPEVYNVDISNNKTNFKRRKKKDLKADRCVRKESTNSRNYRISTYIFDQSWIKDKFGTKDVDKDNALNNLAKLRMKAAEQKTKETELLKTIKRTLFTQQDKCICPESCTCKNETKKSYFGLLRKKLCWNIKTDCNKRANPTFYGHVSSESPESVDVQRRMDYYRSLGNRDFEDIQVNSELYNNYSDKERLIKDKKGDVVLCETDSSKIDESDLKKRDMKYMKIKDIKLAISERFLHLRIQNPLPIVRDLYFALLEASAKRNKDKHKNTAEKGVTALPLVQSCSCQYITEPRVLGQFGEVDQDNYEAVMPKSMPKQKDAAINKRIQSCSCATQCRNIVKEKSSSCIELNKTTEEFGGRINFDKTSSEITVSNVSQSTQSLTESKTDTVCSRVTINYDDALERKVQKDDRKVCNDKRRAYHPEEKLHKRKINIIAKSNKAISTERAELCDVSTLTSDWWSPISERKVIKKHSKRSNRRIKKDKCVCTDGRIVTFRSRAQIIPSDTRDYILSPSRYLLESQKYYNELFLSKFHPANLYTTFPSEVWQN